MNKQFDDAILFYKFKDNGKWMYGIGGPYNDVEQAWNNLMVSFAEAYIEYERLTEDEWGEEN
jgi:hypothetical protein